MARKSYPSDVSDEEWAFVAPYLTLMKEAAPQREHSLREVFDALRWMVRSGSPWRYLPNDFPRWEAVYQQTQRWLKAGCFEAMVHDLRLALRVLQEREFERIGSSKTIKVDVRIIAATNRDLKEEVTAGRFREDLYYRLNVFPLQVAPLRQRRDDIPLLAEHLARKCTQQLGRPYCGIAPQALSQLLDYAWPGNVRELENLIAQAVILHDAPTRLTWGELLTNRLAATPSLCYAA